ncbi:MAG: coproporphyrinogen III oxidase [Epsilonproteobacteria bacterium]|nr:MAG: coproporphyrinogen III oxidase [Campylobacterota bacterium]
MMRIPAKSPRAQEAHVLVSGLQDYFVTKLNALALEFGEGKSCDAVEWGRDKGKHGGGLRYEARDYLVFNRGSVNVSQVHYDDNKNKKLSSATAISTIIHPHNPHAPSVHMHISWTEMRNGLGYWRVMADLNPSILSESPFEKKSFSDMLKKVTGKLYKEGATQGNKYFAIPTLERTRGVSHYYLEGYNGGNFQKDKVFMRKIGEAVIDKYISIVAAKLAGFSDITEADRKEQLDYHTLYFFQVLTLDRGTTSGLLVHDQNDVGIMGSIPSHINRELLSSWVEKMPAPQNVLLGSLLKVLAKNPVVLIDEKIKKALAKTIRKHYKKYPKALEMQASGGVIPPTVDNHS